MCSRQVTCLLLRSASVTKDSALAASCDQPLAAGRVGRTPRGGSTQRATPRGLDSQAIVCRICQDRTRIGPSVRQRPPCFSNISDTEAWHDFRCRAEEFPLLCPKPLRALRIPRRVVLRSGSTCHGETALRLPPSLKECVALLVARAMRESLLTRSFTRKTDARTSDLYTSK